MIKLEQSLKQLKKVYQKTLLPFSSLTALQMILFFSLTFIFFLVSFGINWSIFTERDISRARDWLSGHFYWPGPEMSAGNNLPGPFFYFLLFPPLLFGEGTYTQVILWTILWNSLIYSLSFFFVSKITKHKESLLIFFFIFINIFKNWSNDLNPEFAVMFHVLALISLYYWRNTKNNLYLYLTGFIISLGVQVHLLVATHILTALFFYLSDKPKKIKTLIVFLFLALSPFMVYLILKHFQIIESSSGKYFNFLNYIRKELFSEGWYLSMSYLSLSFFSLFFVSILILFQKYKLKRETLTPSIKSLIIIILIPFFIVIIFKHNWYHFFIPVFFAILCSKLFDHFLSYKNFKKLGVLVLIFLSLVLTLFLKPHPFYHLFFDKKPLQFLFFLFFFLLVLTYFKWNKKDFLKNTCLSLLTFSFTYFSMFLSFNHYYKNLYKPFPLPHNFYKKHIRYKDIDNLMRHIYLETKWTPKKAMKKILIVGHFSERSPLIYYSLAKESLKKRKPWFEKILLPVKNPESSVKKKELQGYFIIQHLKKFKNFTKKDFEDYFLQSNLLSIFLKQELKEKRLILNTAKLYESFWLISYNTTKNSLFPEGFHNLGQAYYAKEPLWLKKCEKTKTFQNQNQLFYCKFNENYLQKTGLKIEYFERENKLFFSIAFFGVPLSSMTDTANLDGISLWEDIQIKLKCGLDFQKKSLPNVGNVLYPRAHRIHLQAQILLAPLKMNFNLNACKKESIKNLQITFKETHTHRGDFEESIVWEWE